MKLKELSVFFPAYNEESNIEQTITKALAILPIVAKKWEIIVVNDGSTDKTREVVEGLIKKDKRIRMITHSPNRGYGAALKSGLYNSQYEWISYTDADGQFDFNEITRLIEKQREANADIVAGFYQRRKVPVYRIWGSKFWELLVRIIFGLKIKDIDCGFKLLRKDVIAKIPKLEAERGPFISSEYLIKAKRVGFKIVQIGVKHLPRQAGKATGADPKVILSGMKDLFMLRKKL